MSNVVIKTDSDRDFIRVLVDIKSARSPGSPPRKIHIIAHDLSTTWKLQITERVKKSLTFELVPDLAPTLTEKIEHAVAAAKLSQGRIVVITQDTLIGRIDTAHDVEILRPLESNNTEILRPLESTESSKSFDRVLDTKNVSIDVFTVGARTINRDLFKLASHTNGIYKHIKYYEELDKHLNVLKTFFPAECTLDLEAYPGCRILEIFGCTRVTKHQHQKSYSLLLGDILRSQQYIIILNVRSDITNQIKCLDVSVNSQTGIARETTTIMNAVPGVPEIEKSVIKADVIGTNTQEINYVEQRLLLRETLEEIIQQAETGEDYKESLDDDISDKLSDRNTDALLYLLRARKILSSKLPLSLKIFKLRKMCTEL